MHLISNEEAQQMNLISCISKIEKLEKKIDILAIQLFKTQEELKSLVKQLDERND